MKKIILSFVVVLLCSATLFSQSQHYKPFRVHISPLSYVIPEYTQGFSGGIGLSIEPAYALSDKYVVGVRIESAIMGVGSELKEKLSAVGSYTLTVDGFFNEGDVRFFGGCAAGYFRTATATVSTSNVVVGGSGFGAAGRVGAQLGHFRLAGEYNLVPNNMSYFSIKGAITIGGGKI